MASAKRKSAVELLQETKAFYVKSETVLDRKQELKNSTHLQVTSPGLDSGLYLRGPSRKPGNSRSPNTSEADTNHNHQHHFGACSRYNNPPLPPTPHSAPPRPPKSPCLMSSAQRRSGSHHSTCSDQLQTKLRRLLETPETKENVFFSDRDRRYERRDDHRNGAKMVTGNQRLLDVEDARRPVPLPRATFDRNNSVCRVHHKSLPDLHAKPSSDTSSSTSSERNVYCEARSVSSNKRWPDSSKAALGEVSSTISSSQYTHRSRSDSVWSRAHTVQQPAPARRQTETHESRISVASIKRQIVNRRPSYESSAGRIQSQFHYGKQSLEHYERQRIPPVARKLANSAFYTNGSGNKDISFYPEFRMDENDMEKRRTILRSKSDIGHRYSKQAVPLQENSSPESPKELDRFFEQLGLNNSDYRSLSAPHSESSSPIFFSSVSSIDSTMAWTPWTSCMVGHENGASFNTPRNLEQPSVVERNARIIKWLCNCRKAHMSCRPR